jgi:hypothetical protein
MKLTPEKTDGPNSRFFSNVALSGSILLLPVCARPPTAVLRFYPVSHFGEGQLSLSC